MEENPISSKKSASLIHHFLCLKKVKKFFSLLIWWWNNYSKFLDTLLVHYCFQLVWLAKGFIKWKHSNGIKRMCFSFSKELPTHRLYCHVPARWGLQQITLAPGCNRANDQIAKSATFKNVITTHETAQWLLYNPIKTATHS